MLFFFEDNCRGFSFLELSLSLDTHYSCLRMLDNVHDENLEAVVLHPSHKVLEDGAVLEAARRPVYQGTLDVGEVIAKPRN
jgi:hypothetical protein